MSIRRAYSPGWSLGEIVTSSQLEQLDKNSTYGLDKRADQSDFFGSVLVATGSGRIIPIVRTGQDTDMSIVAPSGQVVRIPTLTSARTYQMATTQATAGDRMLFYIEGTGHSPSGYAQIVNPLGTGIFRLAMTRGFFATGIAGWNDSAQGDSCELIFNGTEWTVMKGGRPGMRTILFTAAQTDWTCPPGVFEILLFGYGGGGGGAAGVAGTSATDYYAGAGAGGGGSWPRWHRLSVVPGRVYEVVVGAAGAGGTTAGAVGAAGGDSIFREKVSQNVLATFRGADYGTASASVASTISEALGFGGNPVRNPNAIERAFIATGIVKTNVLAAFPNMLPPGFGGFGTTAASATTRGQDGIASAEGFVGGAQGAQGAPDSSYYGGGGGGGGGAGPGGVGGAGGAGGAGKSTAPLSGLAGSNGSDAAANTGAGGGGGGGGGGGIGGGGAGGLGGAGGSGKIVLVFFK